MSIKGLNDQSIYFKTHMKNKAQYLKKTKNTKCVTIGYLFVCVCKHLDLNSSVTVKT